MKATKTLPQLDGTSVDPPNRIRSIASASRSPENTYRSEDRRSIERSRSPYSARGSKRGREDDTYPSRSRDPRRFKVHYEDDPQDSRHRSRISYDDIDQGPSSAVESRYDDRDRYPQNKRHRTRSRSPYRPIRGRDRDKYAGPPRRDGGSRYNGYADDSRLSSHGRGDVRNRDLKDQSVSNRGQSPLPAENARREAKSVQGFSHKQDGVSDTHRDVRK